MLTDKAIPEKYLSRMMNRSIGESGKGSQQAIYTLTRDSYFANLEAGLAEDHFLHTENFFLIDKDRHIRGVYKGTLAFDVQRLIEDLALLKQASRL